MVFDNLYDFINVLEKKDNLRRISTEVDVNLEMAEILRRVTYSKGPAILFENVKGFDIPVLGNAFGTIDRMKIALDTDNFEEIGSRLTNILTQKMPSSILGKVSALPRLAEMAGFAPKIVKKGPVNQIIETDSPTLSFLPALKTWPKDASRFITFGLVLTKNPETEIRNIGVYRMQIYDDKTAGMHWQIHKRGAQHFKMAQEENRKIEVAVVIGADPVTIYSAVAPVPEGLDKFLFAGIMRKKGVMLTKCKTIDLEVPANAEIVSEGYVDPKDLRVEGPFGDHTGYYTAPDLYPLFHLTGVMRREKPVYLTTVVGKPILEDAYIGKVIERSFLPLIQIFQPEVVDINMPAAGWFHGLAIVSIKKRYPGQAKKVMMGLWGLGQLMLTKMIIVVDSNINVHDVNEVIWAVTTRTDPKRDTLILDNVPTDTLDPASHLVNLGSKLGIDATVKWKEEGFARAWQEVVKPDQETEKLVDSKWKEYGITEDSTD